MSKANIEFILAAIVLLAGVVMMFLGFYAVPVGEISASVLTGFGEMLTFVGSVWGIERTYKYKTEKLEKEFEEKISVK